MVESFSSAGTEAKGGRSATRTRTVRKIVSAYGENRLLDHICRKPSVKVRDHVESVRKLMRHQLVELGSKYTPLYDAWVGAAAAFFCDVAAVAFFGGMLIAVYRMEVESKNFRMRCCKLMSGVIDAG